MSVAGQRVSPSIPSSSAAEEAGRAEVPLTLAEPAPRALGTLDQLGLWGNLGVSLLGFSGALVVLQPGGPGTPRMSFTAALFAVVLGTLLGTAAVAVAGLVGTRTGAPAMVLLRGVFGARPSSVPTVLNVTQMVGWGAFELVTIAAAAGQILSGVPQWLLILIGGTASTLLALRPLGSVRVLRRYVSVLVVLSLAYLFFELLHSAPAGRLSGGGWSGFAVGVDSALAVAVSWVPMAADYARHSRSGRATLSGTMIGYAVAQVACYTIGLLALLTVSADADHLFAVFIAVPLGTAVFGVLVVRELDQSFANVYSTTVSVQNLRPGWDRRLVSLAVGALVTVLALAVNLDDYASFLSLIGSVFVPMFAVLVVDYFAFRGEACWDLSAWAPARWLMFLPWAVGFAVYQLINPGQVGWWTSAWSDLAGALRFRPQPWMSASLLSFAVAGALTAMIDLIVRPGRRARIPAAAPTGAIQ
jgi:putative hydroxymethylpyrimidine transporter CytX